MTSPRLMTNLWKCLGKWMCSLQNHELKDRWGIGQMILLTAHKTFSPLSSNTQPWPCHQWSRGTLFSSFSDIFQNFWLITISSLQSRGGHCQSIGHVQRWPAIAELDKLGSWNMEGEKGGQANARPAKLGEGAQHFPNISQLRTLPVTSCESEQPADTFRTLGKFMTASMGE